MLFATAHTIDAVVIGIYLLVSFGLGAFASRILHTGGGEEGYYLAGREDTRLGQWHLLCRHGYECRCCPTVLRFDGSYRPADRLVLFVAIYVCLDAGCLALCSPLAVDGHSHGA